MARWWGPDGFHTPPETVVIDLRVGGQYDLVMVQDSTGAAFPLHYEIAELLVPDGPYTVSGHAEQGWNGSFDKLDTILRST